MWGTRPSATEAARTVASLPEDCPAPTGVRATRSVLLAQLRNWGASDAERALALPGDELVPEPAVTTTRAVSIAASDATVWRWLVQIGQDRGGMYSYDWLENVVGLHIRSATTIREEWQHLVAGDRIRLVPEGWFALKGGLALPVALVLPPHSLVLREEPPETPWNAVWSFHILALTPTCCRLISRSRATRQPGSGRAVATVMDAVALVMTRKMLLGIKERAEREARPLALAG